MLPMTVNVYCGTEKFKNKNKMARVKVIDICLISNEKKYKTE